MSYLDSLVQIEIPNIAPFWKRILSGIVDFTIIWGFYFTFYILTRNEMSYLRFMTFIFCQVYFFIFYSKLNQTIGDMIFKIKSIFIEDNITSKNKYFFIRSLYKSALFVPLFNLFYLFIFYGITIIANIQLMKNPTMKKNKILVWDILSEMVVVEELK